MCLGLSVDLPLLNSFLLIYPLRWGTLLIFMWTWLRGLFTACFFLVVILESFVKKKKQVRDFLPTLLLVKQSHNDDNIYHLFMCSMLMFVAEVVMVFFCFFLLVGILNCNPSNIRDYVCVRFVIWLIELGTLFILCWCHKPLIGWYLAFMFFVVLECYSIMIVYSYYVELCERRGTLEDV